nr:MAG TPA: hypothetical protein [Caudoviricetes sp.]
MFVLPAPVLLPVRAFVFHKKCLSLDYSAYLFQRKCSCSTIVLRSAVDR